MSNFWISLLLEKPICTESGDWDGRRSRTILFKDNQGRVYVGYCYSGIMDGSEFCDFYTDFGGVSDVVFWAEIPD